MLALKIVIGIILALLLVIMLSVMIITERDKPKNIILWTIVFLITQIFGYMAFGLSKLFLYKKHMSIVIKEKEDDIYLSLVGSKLKDIEIECTNDLYQFNKMAYGSSLTTNNRCELITNYSSFKSSVIQEIKLAKEFVIVELVKINYEDFAEIKDALIAKAQEGAIVKFIHDAYLKHSFKKELKLAGVKVYRFSKYNSFIIGSSYRNKRNIISIDGKTVYLGNLNNINTTKQKVDIVDAYLKLKGDIVQDIDLLAHQDVTFASNKYMEYYKRENLSANKDVKMQLVHNSAGADIELMLIKAIHIAKKSVTLQLDEFIPTESIMSLLRFAINSNIEVKLMIPLKFTKSSTYYATRAYAKELAMCGANVYLYDGSIHFNSIIIDSQFVIFGSYNINRKFINKTLQHLLIIEDTLTVKQFEKLFEDAIDNSYRINNAKYMLMQERFFKNFV